MRWIWVALLAASLLFPSCSAPPSEDAPDGVAEAEGQEDVREGSDGDPRTTAKGKPGRRNKDGAQSGKDDRPEKKGGAGSPIAEGGPEGDAAEESSGETASPEASGGGKQEATPSGTRRRSSTRPNPRAGRYIYAQKGWEEFCTGTCSRGDLPRTAQIDNRVSELDGGNLQVVSESRSSEKRSTETTTHVFTGKVEVTRVELRYGSFSNTYEPSPPVRSLQLPLKVGDAWSSSWQADTSGTYSAKVVGSESMVVDGTRVKTFELDTVMQLRGQFRGTVTSIMWVDPRTATAIRTRGKARIHTDFGRFNSNFDTMLLDGPGY